MTKLKKIDFYESGIYIPHFRREKTEVYKVIMREGEKVKKIREKDALSSLSLWMRAGSLIDNLYIVGWSFVWWHINYHGLFNTKAILVEEQ